MEVSNRIKLIELKSNTGSVLELAGNLYDKILSFRHEVMNSKPSCCHDKCSNLHCCNWLACALSLTRKLMIPESELASLKLIHEFDSVELVSSLEELVEELKKLKFNNEDITEIRKGYKSPDHLKYLWILSRLSVVDSAAELIKLTLKFISELKQNTKYIKLKLIANLKSLHTPLISRLSKPNYNPIKDAELDAILEINLEFSFLTNKLKFGINKEVKEKLVSLRQKFEKLDKLESKTKEEPRSSATAVLLDIPEIKKSKLIFISLLSETILLMTKLIKLIVSAELSKGGKDDPSRDVNLFEDVEFERKMLSFASPRC